MKYLYKKLIPSMLVVSMLVAIALFFPVQAVQAKASCRSTGKAIKRVMNSHAVEIAEWLTCLAAAAETASLSIFVCATTKGAKVFIKAWNHELAENTWAHLGPRELTFDKQEGRIVGKTGRLFYTSQLMPIGTKVKFTKTGSRGHADVAICVTEPKKGIGKWKKTVKMVTWDIPKGKESIGQSWEWSYNGEHGDYVFIGAHISGKSAAKRVKYDIQLLQK